MTLELVLTRDQTVAVSYITFFNSCPGWRCSTDEWAELTRAGYCWCDGFTYRAHETYEAPGDMCEPDAKGTTSQKADWQFEDTQHARFEDGSLQL